ncbi:MAG: metal ABC transporter permease [bacterium]
MMEKKERIGKRRSRVGAIIRFEFMQNAIYAGILTSIICGIIGVFVVTKRLVFISGGISHTAFAGLGIAYYLGANPVYGAIIIALFSAIGIGIARQGKVQQNDTIIGVLWAVGMAIGIVFIHITPGYTPNLMSYLFGNILMVSRKDLWLTFFMAIVVIVTIIVFFKEFVALSFDEEFSRVQGLATGWLNILLLILIALTVVMLIQVVGIILVIALLTIPPSISLELTTNFTKAMKFSVIAGMIMTLGGLVVSFYLDIPSGPAIILLGALLLIIITMSKRSRALMRFF